MASLVFALALMVSMVGVAAAHHKDGHDNGPEKACENAENPPDWCDEDGSPGEGPDDGPEAACTEDDMDGLEGTGVASGIVEQVRQGAEDGGAPPELTDGVDTLNCEVIVTLEQAIEGDDGSGGEDPAPPESCQDVVDAMESNEAPEELVGGAQQLCDAIEGDGGGGGEPEVPEDCSGLVDAMGEYGAPEELTDGAQQLCDAIEGDGGGGGEDPTEQIGEGCDTLVEELSALDPTFEEGRAVCEGLEEIPAL